MANHNEDKRRDLQNSAPPDDSALDPSTWLTPFSPGTFLSLQNAIGNHALSHLLQAEMDEHRRNGKHNGSGDKSNSNGHNVTDLQLSAPSVSKQGEQPPQNTTEQTTQTAEPAVPAMRIIVNDDVRQLQPGQMRKTAFLARLKISVCSAAENVLRNTMWSDMGCPYVEGWFSHYTAQDSAYVERALRKFAPDTARAQSASEFIAIVTERVRRRLSQWVEMGEMPGGPEEFAGEGTGAITQGSANGRLFRPIGNAVSRVASGISRTVLSVGSALFKTREDAREVGEPPTSGQ